MISLFAAAGLSLSGPALAGDKPPVFVTSGPVKDKPAIALDPARAYVMLRTDMAVPLYLMRVPSAEDQAAYDKLRADALVEAREKYAKKLASWERDKKAAQKTPGMRVGEKPVEPTEQNFEFTAFGLMASVGIGPMNRFAKGEGGSSTYLHELTPGEYRIYGQLSALAGAGAFGNCFCMGSVKFEARAGEIVDMGVILSKQSEVPKPPQGDSSMPILVEIPNYLGLAPAEMKLDPRLASYTVRRAEYRPVGKLPNYFGVTINRFPEMPGVFRYERDRMVDLTAAR